MRLPIHLHAASPPPTSIAYASYQASVPRPLCIHDLHRVDHARHGAWELLSSNQPRTWPLTAGCNAFGPELIYRCSLQSKKLRHDRESLVVACMNSTSNCGLSWTRRATPGSFNGTMDLSYQLNGAPPSTNPPKPKFR